MAGLIRILIMFTVITMWAFHCESHLWQSVIARSRDTLYFKTTLYSYYSCISADYIYFEESQLKREKDFYSVNGCEKKNWMERLGRYIK